MTSELPDAWLPSAPAETDASPAGAGTIDAPAGSGPGDGSRRDGSAGGPGGSRSSRTSRSSRWLIEWVLILVVALGFAFGVRAFVVQTFYIPSGSMLPTLQIGDRILVDKLSYRFHAVHRGDIVVFRRPPLEQANYADLVKRVIGLPGETLSLHAGHVYVNGKLLHEPWLPRGVHTYPSPLAASFSLNHRFTVPAGDYFVMGDNRTNSADSRYFGPISGSLIVGRVLTVIWPPSHATWVAGAIIVGTILAVVLVVLILGRTRSALRARSSTRGPPEAPAIG